MTFRHLKLFMQVYNLGSITKAANAVGMAQPSVSAAISDLEDFYGAKLFDRIGRSIYPTSAGNTLAEYADSILNQFNESVQLIKDSGIRKTLSVGMVSNFAAGNLPAITKSFQNIYPDVTLASHSYASATIIDMLNKHQIELGIIDCPAPENFNASTLWEDDYVLLCSQEMAETLPNPINIAEYPDLKLIFPHTPGGLHSPLANWLRQKSVNFNFVLHTSSSHTMETFASNGLGALPILRSLAHIRLQHYPNLRIVEMGEDHPKVTFSLCLHKGKSIDPYLQDYINIVKSLKKPYNG